MTRFLVGLFVGSFLSTLFGTTLGQVWFRPVVESYPEYRQEQERRRQVELLLLDSYRRGSSNPILPRGVEVPRQDRIPAPKVPFPTAPSAPVTPSAPLAPTIVPGVESASPPAPLPVNPLVLTGSGSN